MYSLNRGKNSCKAIEYKTRLEKIGNSFVTCVNLKTVNQDRLPRSTIQCRIKEKLRWPHYVKYSHSMTEFSAPKRGFIGLKVAIKSDV